MKELIKNTFIEKEYLITKKKGEDRVFNVFNKNKPLISPSRIVAFNSYFDLIPDKFLDYSREFGKALNALVAKKKKNGKIDLNSLSDEALKTATEKVLEYLEDTELLYDELHVFSPELKHYLHGYVDLLVTRDNKIVVIELKTGNTDNIKPEWIFQAKVYAYILQKELNADFVEYEVLYFNKKTNELITHKDKYIKNGELNIDIELWTKN